MVMSRLVGWFILGFGAAVVLHFSLYRMTLPLKPFIYQAF